MESATSPTPLRMNPFEEDEKHLLIYPCKGFQIILEFKKFLTILFVFINFF